jgi:hypothetical protein
MCIDTKVTSHSLMKDRISLAINGPTQAGGAAGNINTRPCSNFVFLIHVFDRVCICVYVYIGAALPSFSWSSPDFESQAHNGQPDVTTIKSYE